MLAEIGRTPAGSGLGVWEIGVDAHTRDVIVVDGTMAPSVKGIRPVGDVTGSLQFIHPAGRNGWVDRSHLDALHRSER